MTRSQRLLSPTRRRNAMMLLAIVGLLFAIALNLEPQDFASAPPPPQQLTSTFLEDILAVSPGAASPVLRPPLLNEAAVLDLPLLDTPSLDAGQTVSIMFASEPAGASVYVNNRLQGVTPLRVTLPSGVPTPYRVSPAEDALKVPAVFLALLRTTPLPWRCYARAGDRNNAQRVANA